MLIKSFCFYKYTVQITNNPLYKVSINVDLGLIEIKMHQFNFYNFYLEVLLYNQIELSLPVIFNSVHSLYTCRKSSFINLETF